MTTPAYTPLGSSGLAAQPIDFGNPTTPTTPPVKAPTGQTSTATPPATPTTPPAKPSAIVSSQPAAAQIPKIQAAVTQGQTDIATGNANRAATGGALPGSNSANAGKPGYDVFGNAVQGTPLPNGGATAPTPEDTIANTPDTGNQWAYDASGNRVQVPIGNVPPGYASSNPTAAPTLPVTDTVTDPVGNTYKQYSDGTYGKFDATGAYQGQASSQDFQTNKDGQGLLTSLNQVINGTYPLSPTQQAQIDGLKAQFATLIQQQTTANANFTGGTTVAENLYGMGNSLTGLGEIKGTVDAGIAKIADLNSKLTSAVATMEQGFQTDDLTMLKSAYDMYTTSVKDKQDELDKLTTLAQNVQAQVQKAKVDAANEAHQTFQDNLAAENQTMAQKKDTFDEYIQSANLTLAQRKEALDEFTASQASTVAANPGAAGNVSVQADGSISKSDQASYLANLPGGATGELATVVKGVANYTINPSSVPTKQYKGAGGFTQAQVLALAANYDPTFSQSNYANRQALVKNFTSGAYSQNINALNTAVGHIADLTNNFSGLNNAGFTPYNTAKNAVDSLFGAGNVVKASTNIAAATGELASVFKKSGATDAEIKNLGQIDANSSPAQVKAYQEASSQLLASRLSALEQTYTAGMGKPPDTPFLSPDSQTALLKMQQNGLNVQVPELAKAPVVQLQTFHDADPQNASLIDALVNADPTLKSDPQRMVSLLQDQGYLQ